MKESRNERNHTEDRRRRVKLLEQKLAGVVLLAVSVWFVWQCCAGHEDCGGVFIIAPLGLIFLFSRELWIT